MTGDLETLKLRNRKAENYFLGTFGLVMLYLTGCIVYSGQNIRVPQEQITLKSKSLASTLQISEFQKYIPMMKEPFVTQYKNKLEKAIQDTTEINPKIREFVKEEQNQGKKAWYSWAAFFMD